MSIKIGKNNISKIYSFTDEVLAMYVGSSLAYSELLPIKMGALQYYDHNISVVTLASGNKIEKITDLSGNGNHATQTTVAEQPDYVASNPNIASKIFDFSSGQPDIMMDVPSMGAPPTNYTPGTISFGGWAAPINSIAYKAEATSGTDGLSGQSYCWDATNRGWSGLSCGTGLSIGRDRAQVCEHGPGYLPITLTFAYAVTSATFHHYMVVYGDGTPNPKLYIDGVYRRTGVLGWKTQKYLPGGFGGNNNYGTYSGDVAIYYGFGYALTDAEILQLYNYEKSRFGY
jgi:hypothetical protein